MRSLCKERMIKEMKEDRREAKSIGKGPRWANRRSLR